MWWYNIVKLYYLISRYYDPETGRFISADSIDYLDPESLGGLNLYAYCVNNPVMRIDPLGNFGLLTAFLIFVGVTVFASATAGGISAAVHHENVWDGIVNGAEIGLMFSLSLGLTYVGIGTPLVRSLIGSIFAGAGIGSAFSLGINLGKQLEDGGFGSLDMKSLGKSWFGGIVIGGFAGGMSHAGKILGEYFGEFLGLVLGVETFIGKMFSIGLLAKLGRVVGGFLGGFIAGSIINNSATETRWQDRNVPLWFGSILRIIFK